jgi:deoxyribonuclease V
VNRDLSSSWPGSAGGLEAVQRRLAREQPDPWRPGDGRPLVGGCFVCFPRGKSGAGAGGDRGWAGAALVGERRVVAAAFAEGTAGAPYRQGLLALREGPLLEAVMRALPEAPDVLLVNATGRDHPRRAGLALHLGAVLEVPTIGVTHRPLLADGEWPVDERGARSPLRLDFELVGYWLRTRAGTRPLAIHAAWRTDPDVAVEVVRSVTNRRTPEPLRVARRVARRRRAAHR